MTSSSQSRGSGRPSDPRVGKKCSIRKGFALCRRLSFYQNGRHKSHIGFFEGRLEDLLMLTSMVMLMNLMMTPMVMVIVILLMMLPRVLVMMMAMMLLIVMKMMLMIMMPTTVTAQ